MSSRLPKTRLSIFLVLLWVDALAGFQLRPTRTRMAQRRTVIGRLGGNLPNPKDRHPLNVDGPLFVDKTCIDCDTCRWMSPEVYGRTQQAGSGQSYVHHQPQNDAEKKASFAAMMACPTGSIRLEEPDPTMKEVVSLFPMAIDQRIPAVTHLGYHSPKSFGATPYFIARSATDTVGGSPNVMVDTPRFTERLAKALEAKGGVQYHLLTHKDDVGDMGRWKDRFPEMVRVMHKADITTEQQWPYIDTTSVEIQLDDSASTWEIFDGLKVVHTPGHSRGSLTFVAGPTLTGGDGCAFTGDHLAFSGRLGRIDGFGRYGWDTELQSESIKRLAGEDFLWVLPGHGRRLSFASSEEKKTAILHASDVFKQDPLGRTAPGPVFVTPHEEPST